MAFKNFKLETDADGIALVTWDIPGRSMNVLDETSTSEQLGKTAGKDAAKRKATYAALYGIDGARERASALCREAIEAARRASRETRLLEEIARFIVERES